VPSVAQGRTRLGNDHFADSPTLTDIHQDLLAFLGNAPIIGENVDLAVDRLALSDVLLTPRLDLADLSSLLLPSLPDHRLASIASAFNLPYPLEERALPLAHLAQRAFLRLCERVATLQGALQGELARLAARADHPTRWFFQDVVEQQTAIDLASSASRNPLGMAEASRPSSLGSPPASHRSLDVEVLASLLGSTGPLARDFPSYEERPQQRAMLEAVAKTFNEGGQLMVEAGTGTGKSIAYLLPAVTFGILNRTPVVVSTNTLNLQEQLARKDIPDLLEALADDKTSIAGPNSPDLAELLSTLRPTTLKGRANYACGRRVLLWRGQDLTRDDAAFLLRLLAWLPNSRDGDRAELRLSAAEEALWTRANAALGACAPSQCQVYQRDLCFVQRARKRAEAAHLVITNHSLLLSDLAADNRILPEYSYLVLDEAHHLEEVATRHLGFTLSHRTLVDYAQRLNDLLRDTQRLLPALRQQAASPMLAHASTQCATRFVLASKPLPSSPGNMRPPPVTTISGFV
jgi:DNA polymerase-3 subunit epsilon/ATP-dependent DNA helicase DinG